MAVDPSGMIPRASTRMSALSPCTHRQCLSRAKANAGVLSNVMFWKSLLRLFHKKEANDPYKERSENHTACYTLGISSTSSPTAPAKLKEEF
jgi:hypothetical protein